MEDMEGCQDAALIQQVLDWYLPAPALHPSNVQKFVAIACALSVPFSGKGMRLFPTALPMIKT